MYKSIVAIALIAIVAGVHSVEYGLGHSYLVGYPNHVTIVNPVRHVAVHAPGNLGLDIGYGASNAGLAAAGYGYGRRPLLGAQVGGAIHAPGLALGGGVRAGVSGWGAGIQAGVGLSARCPLCH